MEAKYLTSVQVIKYKMREGCEDLVPQKVHVDDAAFDLRSAESTRVPAGNRALIKTGLHLQLPKFYEAQVRPRSGLALKKGITVLNTPGTIDCGYAGDVGVILFNTTEDDFLVERGDRIAQLVIQKLPEVELWATSDLEETVRGSNGFGSTQVK